jgi:Ser/Thr protein kinase RdoA (MazF antagonist)
MNRQAQVLTEFAADVLEGSEPVDDPALPTRLLRVRDAAGAVYVAKLHLSRERYEREHRAYLTWTTALADCAPRLVAADPIRQAILLTSMPGQPADALAAGAHDEQVVHRSAGALLRRLHGAELAAFNSRMGPELAGRLDVWIRRADGLLSEQEHGILLRHARVLAALGPVETTVCHLDFQPQNWIVSNAVVHLVDFEHTRIDGRVRDLTRLAYRYWVDRPDLRTAFLAGYGRGLNAAETGFLHHCGAIEAVTSLVRGHETSNPTLTAHGRSVLSRLD